MQTQNQLSRHISTHQMNTMLPTPKTANIGQQKFPFNKPLMSQNRQYLIKDLPKYDVAMTVPKEVVNEVQLLQDTMRDLEEMRVVESELEDALSMDLMGRHLIDEKHPPIDA